jgi:hypothetical protein
MKALLGCLLCLILATSQASAISGGPGFGKGQVSTTGTYAGVLTPGPLSPGANSIGLFTISVPKTGLGSGSVVLFTAGETYIGPFQGIADPDSAKLFGEIDATFNYVEIIQTGVDSNGTPKFESVTFAAVAAGQMQGRIVANKRTSTAAVRLTGDANVQYSLTINNPFAQIGYLISGFKQSEL